jgi:hypothetical protein
MVVCFGMKAWMHLVKGRVRQCDETLTFQMQAHYIVGSLVGTSIILQITLFVKSAPPVAALAVAGMLVWSSFLLCLFPIIVKAQGITSEYQLVGATIGLITGIAQLVPCYLLYDWMNTAASAILFLLVWLGVVTVIWTAAGWAGMHLIDKGCEDLETRIFSHTESGYIVGICTTWIAWIVMDWVYNEGQTIPMLLFLAWVSLAGVLLVVVHLSEEASLERESIV